MLWKGVALAFALAASAYAQDEEAAELKKRVLEKVREKLAADRATLLRRVERLLDEEFGKEGRPAPAPAPAPGAKDAPPPADDARVKELEKKLKALEEQRDAVAAEVARARREAQDEAIRKEAKREGPNDLVEADALFKEALELHESKSFPKAIRMFKRIFYQFPEEEIGYTSAYNVACGYALSGKKDEALDWLEVAVKNGFDHFDHMRKDPDLDGLRGERRYKKLLMDK